MRLRRLLTLSLAIIMMLALVACGGNDNGATNETDNGGEESEVLRVGMECSYAPYNWTQSDDSNGAVPIEGTNEFAGGYDVEIAKRVAEGLGRELVVVKTGWDGLPPAVQSGKIDIIMAGMSPREERKENIDFSAPYWESDLIMVVKKDSEYIDAKSIKDFAGARVSGQVNTVHYTVTSQLEGAEVMDPMGDFGQLRTALQTGKIDAYVAETPEGLSLEMAVDDLTYIVFDEGEGFEADETEIQIAAGLKKGSDMVDAVSEIIDGITPEEREQIMSDALANQPVNQ